LGLRSLVLESTESLRVTGFALTLWSNAWKALDVVGIEDTLRQQYTQIKGMKMVFPDTGLFTSGEGYETRCVRRKDLLETLVNELPPGTIRYSSKVATIYALNRFKLVHLADGSILKTKVLIGCDEVNSVVSKWLGLAPPEVLGGVAFLKKPNEKDDAFERIDKGLAKYGSERRWRSVSLVSVAYCVGFMQQSKGKMMSYLRKVWFSKYTSNALLKMTNFDCGDLVF
nr:monooxygenase 2-like [Tanacetum cinerariifolium]